MGLVGEVREKGNKTRKPVEAFAVASNWRSVVMTLLWRDHSVENGCKGLLHFAFNQQLTYLHWR